MAELVAVDPLQVTILVDNTTDSLSKRPAGVASEFGRLAARGVVLSGEAICCAHHGLSILLEAQAGGARRHLLFDAGPEAATFERNVQRLGLNLGRLADDVVLSHGHWDHAGGLLSALRSGSRIHIHPGAFASRGVLTQAAHQGAPGRGAPLILLRDIPSRDELRSRGADVMETKGESLVGDGAFYISGEIPRKTSYEIGYPGHMRKEDGAWMPDPLIEDERFVAVHCKGRGLVVFTACSHAGVINVLRAANSAFPSIPLFAVVGGFHLSGNTEAAIANTVDDLRQFGLKMIAPGHCTGFRATAALLGAFGDRVMPLAVGQQISFNDIAVP